MRGVRAFNLSCDTHEITVVLPLKLVCKVSTTRHASKKECVDSSNAGAEGWRED